MERNLVKHANISQPAQDMSQAPSDMAQTSKEKCRNFVAQIQQNLLKSHLLRIHWVWVTR